MVMHYSEARRIDLHCHSHAGSDARGALLEGEGVASADEVYRRAKRRRMDFVTITDQDTIARAMQLRHLTDVLVGKELTAWFPEDRCRVHVLVWGVSAADHRTLQAIAHDVYQVADYLEEQQLAHAVAHTRERRGSPMLNWHIERLMLLFKGFEALNGTNPEENRFLPVLNRLDAGEIRRLSEKHLLRARWSEPHLKTRVGGSGDDGVEGIGRTYTEFPADTRTAADVLHHLRTAGCRPGARGERVAVA